MNEHIFYWWTTKFHAGWLQFNQATLVSQCWLNLECNFLWHFDRNASLFPLQFLSAIQILKARRFWWIPVDRRIRNRVEHSSITPQQKLLPTRWGNVDRNSFQISFSSSSSLSPSFWIPETVSCAGVLLVKWSAHYFSWWELWIGCQKR